MEDSPKTDGREKNIYIPMEDLGVALFQETLMYVNMSGLKDVLLFLASLE